MRLLLLKYYYVDLILFFKLFNVLSVFISFFKTLISEKLGNLNSGLFLNNSLIILTDCSNFKVCSFDNIVHKYIHLQINN